MMSTEPPHRPYREHAAGSFPLLWLFGLTAAALALRMVFLTTKALWFDETVSVFIASQPIERIMPLLAAIGFAAAVLIVVGLRSRAYSRDVKTLLVCAAVAPLLLALGMSIGLNVFAPRYMLFIGPPLALLVGGGAAVLWSGARRARWLAVLLVALVLWPNAVGTLGFYRQPRLDVFDWRVVSRRLAARAQESDAIVFLPGFSRIPVNYYYRYERGSQLRLALTPDGDDVVGPGGARLPAVVAVVSERPRVWILTVPPVPPAVDALIGALNQRSYTVTHLETVNAVRMIVLERLPEK